MNKRTNRRRKDKKKRDAQTRATVVLEKPLFLVEKASTETLFTAPSHAESFLLSHKENSMDVLATDLSDDAAQVI